MSCHYPCPVGSVAALSVLCAVLSRSAVSDSLQPHGPTMDLPGSSVPGILQARILEWVAMPSSRFVAGSGP